MTTVRKAFVLISGGLDSSTVLAIANMEYAGEIEGVSIDYGQRHIKEMRFAREQCREWEANHVTLSAGAILKGTMLTDAEKAIPNVRYDQIEGVSPTYVPFRNGTFLSMITAHAQKWVHEEQMVSDQNDGVPNVVEAGVYFGAHAEDARNWAYPDCTPEFIGAMANAIYIGTYRSVRLHTPLMWMSKYQIVELGQNLGVDFAKTWSCYAGGELHCGKCPTCYARQDAFAKAKITDPTEYAVPRK